MFGMLLKPNEVGCLAPMVVVMLLAALAFVAKRSI